MARVLFASMSVATVASAVGLNASLLWFLSVSGLAVVLGGTLLSCRMMSLPVTTLLLPMSARNVHSRTPLRASIVDGLRLQEAVRYLGGFLALMCGIGIFRELNDPSQIGPFMAIGLLGLLYSQIISEGLLGTRATALQARLAPAPLPQTRSRASAVPVGIGLLLVLLGVAHSASLFSALVSAPFLLYVLLLGSTLSLSRHTGGEIHAALKAAVHRDITVPAYSARHIAVLSTVRTAFALAGSSGMLIGYVSLLGDLSAPHTLAPSIGATVLAWGYGFFFSEVLCRLLVMRLAGTRDAQLPSSMAPMVVSLLFVGFTTMVLFGLFSGSVG